MPDFRATYRLQLGPSLSLDDARDLVPYLAALGISHVYLSPCWRSRPGSTHGYDVLDPAEVNPELGGEAALRALADAAHAAGLGLVLDVVPNHMATDDDNPYWASAELREKVFDLDRTTGRHRRFFDVDELAGVRQEDPEVFAMTHAKVLELVRDGVADGLRIDHPDGLADPAGYLRALADAGVEHVWVEKILEAGELLRDDWVCEGTTGYEFCVDVQALFCDPRGEETLTLLWEELSGDDRPFAAWAQEAKREQAATTFAPEVSRLVQLADVPGVRDAVAALPAYRTYVEPGATAVVEEDRELIATLPAPVQRALLGVDPVQPEWITRFQQTTPPVMAKGVEDTAFYRYLRLLALNEVGGDPGRFSLPVGRFHAARALARPRTLLNTSTHDSKRSADVRARLGALSGMADGWAAAVRLWRNDNAELRSGPAPTPAEELLVYQTLLGAWPVDGERLRHYLIKALREAKQGSNWVEPDEEHEAAVIAFAEALLDHGPFRYGFDGWAARVAEAGHRSALGQLLLKLTCPGVPDIYQGDELEFLALVDPDNRRPVDWDARREALLALQRGEPVTRETAKLDLIHRALALRVRRPGAFAGAYTPISAGPDVCAFLRGDDVLVAVTVRDDATGAGGWDLPATVEGRWRDVLRDGVEHELPQRASAASVLGPAGRALLERL